MYYVNTLKYKMFQYMVKYPQLTHKMEHFGDKNSNKRVIFLEKGVANNGNICYNVLNVTFDWKGANTND